MDPTDPVQVDAALTTMHEAARTLALAVARAEGNVVILIDLPHLDGRRGGTVVEGRLEGRPAVAAAAALVARQLRMEDDEAQEDPVLARIMSILFAAEPTDAEIDGVKHYPLR